MAATRAKAVSVALFVLVAGVLIALGYAETKRRRHLEELYTERELLESTGDIYSSYLDDLSSAVMIVDGDQRFIGWSRGAEQMFKRSREEAIGRYVALIVPYHLRDRHFAAFQNSLAEPFPHVHVVKCQAVTGDDELIDVVIRVQRVLRPKGAVYVARVDLEENYREVDLQ